LIYSAATLPLAWAFGSAGWFELISLGQASAATVTSVADEALLDSRGPIGVRVRLRVHYPLGDMTKNQVLKDEPEHFTVSVTKANTGVAAAEPRRLASHVYKPADFYATAATEGALD
jgi:hypothetical protein